jgi:hypothetical protein
MAKPLEMHFYLQNMEYGYVLSFINYEVLSYLFIQYERLRS